MTETPVEQAKAADQRAHADQALFDALTRLRERIRIASINGPVTDDIETVMTAAKRHLLGKTAGAELLEATKALLALAELIGHMDPGTDRWNCRGQQLIHQDQIKECGRAVRLAQYAIAKAEGAA